MHWFFGGVEKLQTAFGERGGALGSAGEIPVEIHLVTVVAAKAGRHAEQRLGVDRVAATRHVVPIERDPAVRRDGCEEGARAILGGGAGPKKAQEHRACFDVELPTQGPVLERQRLEILGTVDLSVRSGMQHDDTSALGDRDERPGSDPLTHPRAVFYAEERLEPLGLVGKELGDDWAADVRVLVVAEEIVDAQRMAVSERLGATEQLGGVAPVERSEVRRPLFTLDLGAVNEVAREDERRSEGLPDGFLEDAFDCLEVSDVALEVRGHDETPRGGERDHSTHARSIHPNRNLIPLSASRGATVRQSSAAVRTIVLYSSVVALAALAGCSGERSEAPAESSSAATAATNAPLKVMSQTTRTPDYDPNPLALPSRTIEVVPGQKVFTVPAPMLRGAKVGSSLAMRVAAVVGKDGDNILIEGRDGPAYKVHAAYVIPIPDGFKPRPNQPVLAEWAGALRHGIYRKMVKDSFVIRFTDTEDKSDRYLKNAAIIAQTDGFRVGNYAAFHEGADYKQVLLVSPLAGEPKRWLALGFGGAATVVDESALLAVPVSYEPKEGAAVWAVWLGVFRPGIVKTTDSPGLFTIRFERAGPPVLVGWGALMPPVTGVRGPKKLGPP